MLRFELGRGNAHRARGVMERAIQAAARARRLPPAALPVYAAAARALLEMLGGWLLLTGGGRVAVAARHAARGAALARLHGPGGTGAFGHHSQRSAPFDPSRPIETGQITARRWDRRGRARVRRGGAGRQVDEGRGDAAKRVFYRAIAVTTPLFP